MRSLGTKLKVLALSALVACAPDSTGEGPTFIGEVQSALGVVGGDIPIPAQPDGAGNMKQIWDGTYADLLAADALAACWYSQGPLAKATYRSAPTDGDKLIFYLSGKMSAANCTTPAQGATPGEASYGTWVTSRNNPQCNARPGAGTPAAISLTNARSTSDYELPTIASLGLTGARAEAARQKAQEYMAYADLTLCMATRLNEQLDSEIVWVTSQEEVYRLFSLVRERALTAAMQYTLIAKAMAASNTSNTWDIANGNLALMPLRRLRDTATAAVLTRLGNDYAAALKLLVDVTNRSMDVYARNPDAQGQIAAQLVDGTRSTNFGVTSDSGRTRALQSLYGAALWYMRAVATDISDPGVGQLLGLARDAEALVLTFKSDHELDWESNAQAMVTDVESRLREVSCAARSDTSSACLSVPAFSDYDEFLLWQNYRVTLDHARTLTRALTEVAVGAPATEQGSVWDYGVSGALQSRTLNPTMPLLGSHSQSGAIGSGAGDKKLTVDSKFSIRPYRAFEMQALRNVLFDYHPPFAMDVRDHPDVNGFYFRSIGWVPNINPTIEPARYVGPYAVLAYAQETLPQLEGTPFYTGASSAVALVDAAIGKRSVIIRPRRFYLMIKNSAADCAVWKDNGTTPTSCTTQPFTFTESFEASLVTQASDPVDTVASGPLGSVGGAQAVAVASDSASVGFSGLSIGTLNGLTRTPLQTTTLGNSRQRRTAVIQGSGSAYGPSAFLVAGTDPDFSYEPIAIGGIGTVLSNLGAVFVSFGGTLHDKAEKLWEFNTRNWSKPRYDAFGLPSDWVPLADASLHGGTTGEEDYQYLLRTAADAAAKASDATKTAFQTLSAQSIDVVALDSADRKGQELSGLQLSALCGAAQPKGCLFSTAGAVLPDIQCGSSSSCSALQDAIAKVVPSDRKVPLAKPVADVLKQGAISFQQFEGGELERLFLAQASAWNEFVAIQNAAAKTTIAGDQDIDVAKHELEASKSALAAVQAESLATYQELKAAGFSLEADRLEVVARQQEATNKLNTAEDEESHACSQQAADDAVKAGRTYTAHSVSPEATYNESTGDFTYERNSNGKDRKRSQSFSVGPIIAAEERCRKAKLDLEATQKDVADVQAALNKKLTALDEQVKVRLLRESSLKKREDEATERRKAAESHLNATKAAALATVASQMVGIQAHYDQLVQSGADIDATLNRANLGVKQVQLEASLSSYDARARFGVRRRFQSYDLWRARALNESARRLAVSARRAIEARFAVDLASLRAEEPFVAAPTSWANDIYRDDLRPPAALGTTAAPSTPTGFYADAVGDYVNNLNLFVTGYAVARPTTAARSDAEVVQLPGPASVLTVSGDPGAALYLDADSAGWSFYCEETNNYVPYPGGERFSVTGDELATACNGKPPSKARLSFTVDPWGRLNGSQANPPFEARYNARWARLAINLVGVGVRDCRLASDQDVCYAEPYLRYTMRHHGPADVTTYDESWRELAIPSAVIEAGKALAIEDWLDPVTHGWNVPAVAAVARQEFAGRPLGGAYEIEIDLGPEVRVENIERVQVLTLTDYWVRQEQ